MARSSATLAALFILVTVVLAPYAESFIECPIIHADIAPCIEYVKGLDFLALACCAKVGLIDLIPKTIEESQRICLCFKNIASGIYNLNLALGENIPNTCGVSTALALNPYNDCYAIELPSSASSIST